MKFSPLAALAKLMQYDLFDPHPPLLIDVAPQTELPNVLAQLPHGVQLGSHFVPYQLRRSKRRSIGFMIAEEGLRVTAPRWTNLAEINAALISKQRWILTKLQEQQNRPAAQTKTPTNWTSGAKLPFLGQLATLQVHYGAATSFNNTTGLITLNLPTDAQPEQCKKHLHAWLMQQARHQFSERLPHFAKQLGVQYHSFTLTNARTLWGSCSPNGKIRLNWRLIHLTPHVIDYVIAHELAHLHEMNHSPRFWATVEKVFPDYVAARGELRRVDMRTLPEF
jgi:predicted metal-dependent hydrolase